MDPLTLRVTQLRDDAGRLITIPNSQIALVENLTRTWSRIDFKVTIAYGSALDRAIEVMADVAQQFCREAEWAPLIIGSPEILGVESFSHAGVVIRIWIVTLPLRQYPVGREFNRRVYLALQSHGIGIGIPQEIDRVESPTP